jgi:prepilin-type N-terminal cleavage/methylation domain-containing protein/prepilin-type processing-associated H-X9-DG protein
MSVRSFRDGFTLVELLVVIAIIGTLVGLLLPAVQSAREASRRSTCSNNLKQLALGLHNHHDAFKRLPASSLNENVDPRSRMKWGWTFSILPYIEQATLYDACMAQGSNLWRSAKWMDTTVQSLARQPIATLLCPSCRVGVLAPEAKYAADISDWNIESSKSNYLASGGPFPSWGTTAANIDPQLEYSLGAMRKAKGVTFNDITDGLSKTFLIGEAGGNPLPGTPGDADRMPGVWAGTGNEAGAQPEVMRYTNEKLNSGEQTAFGSFHPGGANFAMCDGAVVFIRDTIGFNTPSNNGGIDVDTSQAPARRTAWLNASRGVFQKLSSRADGNSNGND